MTKSEPDPGVCVHFDGINPETGLRKVILAYRGHEKTVEVPPPLTVGQLTIIRLRFAHQIEVGMEVVR